MKEYQKALRRQEHKLLIGCEWQKKSIQPNTVNLLLFITLLLVFVACSCAKEESKPAETSDAPASAYSPQEAMASFPEKIYLKPPYTDWQWRDAPSPDTISLGNAVEAVLKQAGVRYDSSASHNNVEPAFETQISPVIEGQDWRSALNEILLPFNLTYYVENYRVTLVTPEQAAAREQTRNELSRQVERFISAGYQVERLPDPVIIFPLSGSDNKTNETGTLLSLLGMLKATYIPQKILNLHFPSILNLYHEKDYFSSGHVISSEEQRRICARFGAKTWATGSFTSGRGSSFRITLNFEGEGGPKQFVKDGTGEELSQLPSWIAGCVHEYCQIDERKVNKGFMNAEEFSSPFQLNRLVEIETRRRNSTYSNAIVWTEFLNANPHAIFARYRDSLMPRQRELQAKKLRRLNEELGPHGLLEFIIADWDNRCNKHLDSVPQFLELLRRDFQNEVIYKKLDDVLLPFGLGESAAAIHDFWKENAPDSSAPYLAEGQFYIDYAWNIRGTGREWTISEEADKAFRERLKKAEEYLLRSYELNPADPRAASAMIAVAAGLAYDRTEMEAWFERAIKTDPDSYLAYQRKVYYLLPIWHGTEEEVFAFARASAQNSPENSRIALLPGYAHEQMAHIWAKPGMDYRGYYKNPLVWDEVKQLYQTYLERTPDSSRERNEFAKYAYFAQDYAEAARQFRLIEEDIDLNCWSRKVFNRYREDAFLKLQNLKDNRKKSGSG